MLWKIFGNNCGYVEWFVDYRWSWFKSETATVCLMFDDFHVSDDWIEVPTKVVCSFDGFGDCFG